MMLPTALLIPTYRQMLQTLRGLLEKAPAHVSDQAETLLSARLANDMLPLAAQIRFAAYQAQEAVFRLRGQEIPEWLAAVAAEGRNADTAPGDLESARKHLDDAQNVLADVPSDSLDKGTERRITLELPGLTFDMTGEEYVRDWALPQFYFHVVTAYAILRHHGVPIGKADYVPHIFAYLRDRPPPDA